MGYSRRRALSVFGVALSGGCLGLSGSETAVRWRANLADGSVVGQPFVDGDSVAVVTDTGALRVLDASTGEPRSADRRRPGRAGGTPPVPVADGYLTVTDEVRLVDENDELVWTEPLPRDSHATSRSRPVTVGGGMLVGTSYPALVAVDVESREVARFGDATVDAQWWSLSADGSLLAVGEGNLETTVVDTRTGDVRWQERSRLTPYPTFTDESVVTAASVDGLQVQSYGARSGDMEWRTDVPGEDVSYAAPLDDGVLVVSQTPGGSDRSSFVTVLDPATGDVRAQSDVDGVVNQSGTTVDRTAYLTGLNGAVYSVKSDGTVSTTARADRPVTSPPAVSGDEVIVGDEDGGVQALALD